MSRLGIQKTPILPCLSCLYAWNRVSRPFRGDNFLNFVKIRSIRVTASVIGRSFRGLLCYLRCLLFNLPRSLRRPDAVYRDSRGASFSRLKISVSIRSHPWLRILGRFAMPVLPCIYRVGDDLWDDFTPRLADH